MTVSNTSTWDENPPRRPALGDITGGTKTNRPGKLPDPVTQPCAEEDNQRAKQIAGAGAVLPMALLYVTFPAGVPTIASVRAPGSNVSIANFTAVDNANGDTTIHWLPSVLPAVWSAPSASQADDTEIDRIRAFYTTGGVVPAGSQGVRVKTKLGGVATDAAILITIY